MNISPQTSIERKLLFIEALLNNTNEITKVSPLSVLDGIATGIGKISSKAEKDIFISLSKLFPNSAYGTQLDRIAENFGIGARLGSLGSSGYVKVIGTIGTRYSKIETLLKSNNGLEFKFQEDFVIGEWGWCYAPVKSIGTGLKTNVGAYQITQIWGAGEGHRYLLNEFEMIGGRDVESDESFRVRIKEGGNLLARSTTKMIEQRMILRNSKVLRCIYQGINSVGKVRIAVVTVNGQALTETELNELTQEILPHLSLIDSQPYGTSYIGIQLINIEYQPIDISFRVRLLPNSNPDQTRMLIQQNLTKYLNHSTFDPYTQKVEWDNLLQIIKTTNGVDYVPDEYFLPRADQYCEIGKLPRLRGFKMMGVRGEIIQNLNNSLSPIYAQHILDTNYISTVL
jgi:uncharacterized phage protein gp47/JayE